MIQISKWMDGLFLERRCKREMEGKEMTFSGVGWGFKCYKLEGKCHKTRGKYEEIDGKHWKIGQKMNTYRLNAS